jgi:magnesium chelatase family protein
VCSAADIAKYRGRLSGPLSDRIDLHVNVTAVPLRWLADAEPRERSADVRTRVEQARRVQRRRYRKMPGDVSNGRVPGRWLDRHGGVATAARELLAAAAERGRLSARSYHRVLRVARTIADLDQTPNVESRHVGEALRYKQIGFSSD